MLAQISSKSATRTTLAAQRCLSARQSSSLIPGTSSSSISNGTVQNSKRQFSRTSETFAAKSRHATFEPKPAYVHPESTSLDSKLPSSALRSLFALHHASRNFITPQTLDKAIDEAFSASNSSAASANRVEKTLQELELEVEQRRLADFETHPFAGRNFEREQHQQQQRKLRDLETYGANATTLHERTVRPALDKREQQVRAALYGVELAADNTTMPGLDSLEDAFAAKHAEEGTSHPGPKQD